MSLLHDGHDCPPNDIPWLSVIIPALSPDKELARCITSVELSLSGGPLHEIILVLPPAEVAGARKLFPGVHVCADSRKGIYAAMNDGAKVSAGRYLYFIGKDDIMLAPAADALAILAAQRPTALFCDVYWGDRGTYHGRPSRLLILGRNVCHQGVIYSRDVFVRHGPYLRRMTLQADHLLNLKILWDRSLVRPVYLSKPIAWYSGSGFSVVRGSDPVFWRAYPAVMRRYVGRWAAMSLRFYRAMRGV